MKSALRSHYASEKQDVAEVFKMLDQDESGNLDIDEAQLAAAILGGALMQKVEVKKVIDMFDTDGDELISLAEFRAWWKMRTKQQLKAGEQVDQINEPSYEELIDGFDREETIESTKCLCLVSPCG